MSNELFTSNLSSGVCENLILLIIVLERLFWPIVFFAFIGLSISPPVDEVDVNKLVIKCENNMYPEYDEVVNVSESEEDDEVVSVSESEEDDDDDSEYVEETEDEITDNETEDGTTDNETEDGVTDNESEDDESDSGDSGWADEDEEDDVNDSDYVQESEEDESDSGDSGYEEESDEEEVLYVVPNVQIYRPNYCLRTTDLLTI